MFTYCLLISSETWSSSDVSCAAGWWGSAGSLCREEASSSASPGSSPTPAWYCGQLTMLCLYRSVQVYLYPDCRTGLTGSFHQCNMVSAQVICCSPSCSTALLNISQSYKGLMLFSSLFIFNPTIIHPVFLVAQKLYRPICLHIRVFTFK